MVKEHKEGCLMRSRSWGRLLLGLINLMLCTVIATHVWGIIACPSMTDPSHCVVDVYPAGCGPWCYAGNTPVRSYYCCCPATWSCPNLTNACCYAVCDLYDCFQFITHNPCPNPTRDVYFIGFAFICPSGCHQIVGGDPMEGHCD